MDLDASNIPVFFAFRGGRLLARGKLGEVGLAVRKASADCPEQRVSLYEEHTGAALDIDTSGNEDETLRRLRTRFPHAFTETADSPGSNKDPAPRRPGRPRLGVVSREISLLPRHWQWLREQRGGASATLRRLVDRARKDDSGEAAVEAARNAAHKFMWDAAGDREGFEEASRALFAENLKAFERVIAPWPADLRGQLGRYLDAIRAAGHPAGPSAS